MSKELSDKITTETLRKIASNEEYDENEILCIAEYLFNMYEYDFNRHFGLITTEDPSESYVINQIKELNIKDQQPFFIIYNKGIKHWVCLAITYLYNSVIILYKDSFGIQIPHNLRETIGDCLKEQKIRFESHTGMDQSDESSSGPICLRNLQVLLKGLKSDYIKVPLIEKFQKVRFCTQYGVQNVKREFRLWLQQYLICGLEVVATELINHESYENFHKSLCFFLDDCSSILKDTYILSSNYTSILKSEAKKKDQDSRYESDHKTQKAMKDARDKFWKNNEIQRSLKFDEHDFIDLDNDNIVYNLEIQEKYPEQMQKFTKIFAVLAQAEMNKELEVALKKISNMLNIEYEKIKIYFEQSKIPRRPDFSRNDFTPQNHLSVLEKAIDVIKLKSKHVKESLKQDVIDKKIKNWDRLMSELVLDVHTSCEFISKEDIEIESIKIRESMPKIEKYYAEWSKKGVAEISAYANACKTEKKIFNFDQICEAISILDRANELATGGYRLRAPQILSVLVFLTSMRCDHGKLCQIESGEGKTVIVSLLATIVILQGEKTVDVITSSTILAQEGVDSRKLFYSMFNISVAINAPGKTYAQGARKCYLADVVYGSISDFQFDYLRDTAEGLGTMSGRQFGRVILDEVDNMLVDNGRHIAKISSPFPGMENLKYIYLRIWNELLAIENDLIDDFQDKLDKFTDLKSTKDMAVTQFIKIFDASMIGRMEERIKVNLKDLDFKFAPTHCLNYAQSMISKWIGNAIRARYFIRENEQYSVKETNGELAIVPVDYSNTGVTLKNTVWSYGLHQFVQIKHNLRITPESLTSSCISNYAYIGKYGNKIFGLTGTLGSKAEQDLLSSIYNVDYAKMPTYKIKVFIEMEAVVVADNDWCYEVTLKTIGMIRTTGRAVLIICKTIADLLQLEEQFKVIQDLSLDCKVKMKKFQDEDSADVTREIVAPGDVIIATNIAGRGADFKTSRQLENNGGLHVCIGFCPDNERVREQAFFRTSRQGNLGSAQLVVRESEIRKLNIDTNFLDEVDFDEVKRRIDINERERLNVIKYSKIDVLRYEDTLFSLFSDMCQELKNNNVITWGHSYLMKDLREYWAFWLEDQNFECKKYSLKEAMFIFYSFKNHDTTKKIISGTISQNPYYGVLQADFFLKNDEIEKAKSALVNSICLSKNVMYPAFVTLFDLTVEEKGPLLPKFRYFLSKIFANNPRMEEKALDFSTEIQEYLRIAHTGLSEEITFIENHYFCDDYNDDFKRILVKPFNGKENLLVKHLAAKLTCLKVYRNNLEILLEVLEGGDTQMLSVSKRISDYLKNFKPDTKEEKQTKDLITEPELMELSSKGLKIIYSLKKIAMVSEEILKKVRVQILGALTLIARASAFPPLTFTVANIVSIMIAEAIASVVLVFFKETKNTNDFTQKSEYLKGKSLNYIVSLMISRNLNFDVCVKIFLRMVRHYRESYYLLENSNENVKLIKSVNSTEISNAVKKIEKCAEYGRANYIRKIRVPENLAVHFFEKDIGNTCIAQLAEFFVEKEITVVENENGVKDGTKIQKNTKKLDFLHRAKDSQSISRCELYLKAALPTKYGGCYDEICNQFTKSNSFICVNLVPWEVCLKDTPYASIPKSQLPTIAMLKRDHESLHKFRFNYICHNKSMLEKKENTKSYVVIQKELLMKGNFWIALKNDITDILAISKYYELNQKEFANYTTGIVQMLRYCKDNDISEAPEINQNISKGRLLNQEQYNAILQQLKLKHEIF